MSIDPASGQVKATSRSAGAPAAAHGPGTAWRPTDAARASDTVDRRAVEAYLWRAARALRRHRALLDRLDAALGDGDHGENMAVGFDAVLRTLPDGGEQDIGTVLRSVGHALVASVGGASGPLYGTAFMEAGFALGGMDRVGSREIADALDAAARGLARRGRCGLGDKTILDALAPAVETFRSAAGEGEPIATTARRAAWAAHAGMRATTPLVARRGLALRLGERSRGHQDPGATSCFLLVRAMVPGRTRATETG